MIAEIDAVLSLEPDSDPVGILDNPDSLCITQILLVMNRMKKF
jgi:hypothetical protein